MISVHKVSTFCLGKIQFLNLNILTPNSLESILLGAVHISPSRPGLLGKNFMKASLVQDYSWAIMYCTVSSYDSNQICFSKIFGLGNCQKLQEGSQSGM